MITEILHYPKKDGITKAQVMKQKNEFEFSKAWIFKETSTEYTLSFDDTLATKYYTTKIPSPFFK